MLLEYRCEKLILRKLINSSMMEELIVRVVMVPFTIPRKVRKKNTNITNKQNKQLKYYEKLLFWSMIKGKSI